MRDSVRTAVIAALFGVVGAFLATGAAVAAGLLAVPQADGSSLYFGKNTLTANQILTVASNGKDITGSATAPGAAPATATYITQSLDGTLSAERTLAAESSVLSLTDGGANGAMTVGVAADGITDAKLANMAALSVKGRSANSAGDPADIAASAASDAVLRESGSTIGFGTIATAGIAADAVTYAKIQNISATQKVLGRNTAGAGDTEEVSASGVLDWIGSTRGSLLYRGAGGWSILAPGTSGYALTSNGAGADPSYTAIAGSGADTVTINGAGVSDLDLDDATPAALGVGSVNVKWQKDSSTPPNVSAYVTGATTGAYGATILATDGGTTGSVQGNDARFYGPTNVARIQTTTATSFGSTETMWGNSAVAITPRSTSSRILVMARGDLTNQATAVRNHTMRVRRKIGGAPAITDTQVGTDSVYRCTITTAGNPADGTFTILGIDSPATTSSTQYALSVMINTGSNQADGAHGELVVMEIGP